MPQTTSRRLFLATGATAVAAAAGARFSVAASPEDATGPYAALLAPLDRFVESYMRAMNAPGMTLALADRDGVQRVATYGLGDVDRREPVRPDELFHIGSITKSFVGLCLLQLREEGRLDLHRPVLEYVPWFRVESRFPPITTHHLLTHTAALPGNAPLFLSDPAARHRASRAPGESFHYCNTGYELLGHLVAALDGRPLAEALRARLLEPLGMTETEPVITLEARGRMVRSYSAWQNDRPFPRGGRLAEAPALLMTHAAGCVASTARDMGRYAAMLASRGLGPKGRVVSAESFALFSKAHVKAPEFGPAASYGYGIAVETRDGRTILRHTGGMVSFASSLQVDVDEGTAAFASINAMQGYRPNPVTQHALELVRARRGGRDLPPSPEVHPATRVENAGDYAGVYRSPDGRTLEVVAEGTALSLVREGRRVALETLLEADAFFAPGLERFPLAFGRREPADPKSPVVEAAWGPDWYAHPRYGGPTTFTVPDEWRACVGHYRNENPWVGSLHIFVRKGRLTVEGVPLVAGEDGTFQLADEERSPEWLRFADVANGKAMRLKASGEDYWRVDAD